MEILLVGNGFDLEHDLPTSYSDFLAFCQRAKRIYTYKETAPLLANSTQAAALAGLEQNASIHLALAARYGSTEKADLMERQEDFFVTNEEVPESDPAISEPTSDAQ